MIGSRILPSGRVFLFAYFGLLTIAGSVLLSIPAAWEGATDGSGLRYIDALFTAMSAVSVTGLGVVDTSQFSGFGTAVILILIQAGGLGVITITTLYIAATRHRLSVQSRKLVSDYFLPSIEFEPRKIVRKIAIYTLIIEVAGALLLFPLFASDPGLTGSGGIGHTVALSVFHAISAFCNAGFSMFSNGLQNFSRAPAVLAVMASLVILGGLGFVVMDDLRHRIFGKARHLQMYSRLMLVSTAGLLFSGTVFFLIFESSASLAGIARDPGGAESAGLMVMNAFFQSTMPRTAGFDAIPPADLSFPGQIFTMFLMFVGGGAGSTAGGLKVATFVVLLLVLLRGLDEAGDLRFGHRSIAAAVANRCAIIFVRMSGLLFVAALALVIVELFVMGGNQPVHILVFETISAFSTVGLSLGATSGLSDPGKLVVIMTMFAGRVGAIALAMPVIRSSQNSKYRLPKEDVLIG